MDESLSGTLSAWPRWSRGFDDLFGRVSQAGFPVDIRQDGEDLVVTAELPGLARDEIDITVHDGVLTIASEHKTEKETDEAQYHVRERTYGAVSRSFRLPKTADGEHVAAQLADGVLTLRIPTLEEAKPRRIEVK
jgi:HSP20 family protein